VGLTWYPLGHGHVADKISAFGPTPYSRSFFLGCLLSLVLLPHTHRHLTLLRLMLHSLPTGSFLLGAQVSEHECRAHDAARERGGED
jgi:hypothetical protein